MTSQTEVVGLLALCFTGIEHQQFCALSWP